MGLSTDWVGGDSGTQAMWIRRPARSSTSRTITRTRRTRTAAQNLWQPLLLMSRPCTFVSTPLVLVVMRLGMLPCPWLLLADRGLGEDAVRGESEVVVILCVVIVLLCEARLTKPRCICSGGD